MKRQWEPVQYFNNKIICDLVEEKFKGIISILVSPPQRSGASKESWVSPEEEEEEAAWPSHGCLGSCSLAPKGLGLGRQAPTLILSLG